MRVFPVVFVTAVIFAGPMALLAAWNPWVGTAVIALAISGAALIRPD